MSDTPEPVPTEFRARCGGCGHVWTVVIIPMNLSTFCRALGRATCPKCGGVKNLFVAPSKAIEAVDDAK